MRVVIAGVALILIAAGIYFGLQNSFFTRVENASEHVPSDSTAANPTLFSDKVLGFSFKVPEGLRVQKMLDDSGETLLVQSADASEGFEIYITPFDESGSSLTEERIEKEAGLKVENATKRTVGAVADGVEFDSIAQVPHMHHIWFAYNGYLYQSHTWAIGVPKLQSAIESWKFTTHE